MVGKKSTTETTSTLISNHTFSLSEMFSIKSEPTLVEHHDTQVEAQVEESGSSLEQLRPWHNFMDINQQMVYDLCPDPFTDEYNM